VIERNCGTLLQVLYKLRKHNCTQCHVQHLSVWNDVVAASLKVWCQIENLTLSVDAIYLKKNPANFHPDLIWNYGVLGFLDSLPNNTKNKLSRDMRSVPDLKMHRYVVAGDSLHRQTLSVGCRIGVEKSTRNCRFYTSRPSVRRFVYLTLYLTLCGLHRRASHLVGPRA